MTYSGYLSKMPRLEGKTIVVTGANSGIGLQTTKHLCYLGARVIMACRSRERTESAMRYVNSQVSGADAEFALYDQASFTSIERFAASIAERRIDGIIFNAGVCAMDTARKTEQGFDLVFGTNYIGTYCLAELLREKMKREHGRMVFVTSLVARPTRDEALEQFSSDRGGRLYGYSKLCIARYAYSLMCDDGLESVLVHPGVSGTNIVFREDSIVPSFIKTPGRHLLDRFENKGALASLCNIRAICEPYRKAMFIRPMSLFECVGMPGVFTMPEKFRVADFDKQTASLISGHIQPSVIHQAVCCSADRR